MQFDMKENATGLKQALAELVVVLGGCVSSPPTTAVLYRQLEQSHGIDSH